MANNSTIPISCSISNETINLLYLISYYILCPICFIIGLPSQLTGALACYKESKKTITYIYQFVVMINSAIVMILAFIFVLSKIWSGSLNNTGYDWYVQNYVLMWYSARLATPMVNIFSVVRFLMLVATSMDRLLTFLKPYSHATFPHNRLQKIYLSIALSIGSLASIFDIWRYIIIFDGNRYKLITDTIYTTSPIAMALSQVRNAINTLSISALILFNASSLIFFKKQNQSINTSILNDKRLAKQKEAAKTLLMMTVCQSVTTCATKIIGVGYYFALYSYPTFANCGGRVVSPFMDTIGFLYWVVDFYSTIAISRPFRKIVKKSLPERFSVTPTSSNNQQNVQNVPVNEYKL